VCQLFTDPNEDLGAWVPRDPHATRKCVWRWSWSTVLNYDGSAPPVQLRVVHESTRRGRRRAVSGIGWSIPITHSGRHLPSMRPTPLAFIAHLVLMPRLSNTLINAAPIRASKPRPFFITPSLPPPSSSSALLAHAPPLPPPALAV
jgi:hypothetical protein